MKPERPHDTSYLAEVVHDHTLTLAHVLYQPAGDPTTQSGGSTAYLEDGVSLSELELVAGDLTPLERVDCTGPQVI